MMSQLPPGLIAGAALLFAVPLLGPGPESNGELQLLIALALFGLALISFLVTPVLLFFQDKSLWKNAALLGICAALGVFESNWVADRHRTAQLARAEVLIRLIDDYTARHKGFPKSLADVGPEATAMGSTGNEEPSKVFIYSVGREGTYWILYYGRPSFSATVYRSDDRRWQVIDLH